MTIGWGDAREWSGLKRGAPEFLARDCIEADERAGLLRCHGGRVKSAVDDDGRTDTFTDLGSPCEVG